ncbi:hypothetical protein [Motilibacter deserti]|uniref:Uncharacterized protein n=1 Tax=Motilibacter deserti TaxID=2714956 RepID=A0ABX0GSG0_9ACTN|nr:hypothetical protein [Motilibacter deserti]NHC12676.1 hypothetical protein [Motilibacter deserti]
MLTATRPLADLCKLDELTRRRLGRQIEARLGPIPLLDLHLDVFDPRGTRYAELALPAWDSAIPDAFFGLVRHVVRTQLSVPSEAPDPDVETWLAAGRPADPHLGAAWDQLAEQRYAGATASGPHRLASRDDGSGPRVARMDRIVRAWPADQLFVFAVTYGAVERLAEQNALPPCFP